jgi:hypothetical protein
MVATSTGLKRRVEARLAEQRRLVESLLELREQVPGSLFSRYGRCGKPACACAAGGPLHGPYWVLSRRSGGRGSFAYVGRGFVGRTRQMVGRYRRFRSGLKRLRALNEELVELLRRYQEERVQRAGQDLALAKAE